MANNDIDHPAIKLVQEGYKHVGSSGHAWVQHMTGVGNLAWCAATQCAIAIACGYENKICPKAIYTAAGFGQSVCKDYRGTYIAGPKNGGRNVYPQVGDYILFIYGSASYLGGTKYGASHIGLVAGVSKTQITTIEGNSSHTYKVNHYSPNYKCIAYYARPRWSILGASDTVPGNSVQPTGGDSGDGNGDIGTYVDIYNTKSTRADAFIREVCYWNEKSSKTTTTKTNTMLSLINYTSLLSAFAEVFMLNTTGSTGDSGSDNIDALGSKERTIVKYLINKGLNTAAAIGVIANIWRESNFKLDAVSSDGNYSIGLCQWTFGRKTNLIKAVPNWKTNMTGQLDFLWSELSTSYKNSVLKPLMKVANTLGGAKDAAEIWVRKFEVPAHIESEVMLRQNKASECWRKVVTNSSGTDNYTTSDTIKTHSGKKIAHGKQIKIPSSVNQNGMTSSYTPYIRNWSAGTVQRKLYNIWNKEDRPKKGNGMVMILGYYCIALTPELVPVGHIVSIYFKDSSHINCIVADQKGAGRRNRWGHYLGSSNKVDVVEWESTLTAGHNSQVNADLKSMKVFGKKVAYIVDYGNWLQ